MNRIAAVVVAVLAFGAAVGLASRQPGTPARPVNRVSIALKDGYRVISANGIPDHDTGQFPHRRCPNTIREQRHEFRIPAAPAPAKEPTRLRMQAFGVAVNGVPFDPFAAEWWNHDRAAGWQYEPMSAAVNLGTDASNAHVQPGGAYHYHGLPRGLMAKLGETPDKMLLIGWAADGFPMYAERGHTAAADPKSAVVTLRPSYRLKTAARPTGPGGPPDGSYEQDYEYVAGAGDLDECNGRRGVTPEFPDGTYYYVVTAGYPYIPRFYRGTPDPSFMRGPPKKP